MSSSRGEIWFRLQVWFHPRMKGKQFHPRMKSMSKTTWVFLVSNYQNIIQSKTKMWLRTYKGLNLPSTTTRGTRGGKSVHYKIGVLAVIHRWSYVGRHRKISFRPGTEKNLVFTWIFVPGMKFRPGAEDREEIVPGWANFTPGSCKHQKPNDQTLRPPLR